MIGRSFMGDGVATTLSGLFGGSGTTTYAENIGVMAATRIYSTLAYYIAAVVAILFGFCPKFGAVVAATPGGVLGGITLVLYGMIGLLGAKIWIENRVNFANPVNLVPIAAAIIAGIGNLSIKFTNNFSITGIAAGTLIAIIGYHLMRWLAPPHLREESQGPGRAYEGGAMISTGNVETPEGEVSPFADENPEATTHR
jgi:xanthine/uracil permease